MAWYKYRYIEDYFVLCLMDGNWIVDNILPISYVYDDTKTIKIDNKNCRFKQIGVEKKIIKELVDDYGNKIVISGVIGADILSKFNIIIHDYSICFYNPNDISKDKINKEVGEVIFGPIECKKVKNNLVFYCKINDVLCRTLLNFNPNKNYLNTNINNRNIEYDRDKIFYIDNLNINRNNSSEVGKYNYKKCIVLDYYDKKLIIN